jgi:hypothetical protein
MQVGGDVAVNDLDDAGLTGPAGRNAMLTRVMEDVRCLDRRVRGGGGAAEVISRLTFSLIPIMTKGLLNTSTICIAHRTAPRLITGR